MAFTSTPITVKDSASADKSLIAYNDGTSSAFAHPLLDNAGAIINPATEDKQDEAITAFGTANTHLNAIETAVEALAADPATATQQAAGNTSMAAISTNLGVRADSTATTDTGTFSLIALFKRALQSLTTIIANTGAGSVNLTITPTVTAGAYTSGQVAGGKLSLTNAVRVAAGSGIIQTVSVSKKTALTAPYDVYFFHTDPAATFTDNAALPDISADLGKLIGVAHCTDLVDNGTPKTLQATNLALPFKLAAGTTLFAVIVARGGETLASTSAIVLNVTILQD